MFYLGNFHSPGAFLRYKVGEKKIIFLWYWLAYRGEKEEKLDLSGFWYLQQTFSVFIQCYHNTCAVNGLNTEFWYHN